MDHTVSDQRTAISTLDHSATTPRVIVMNMKSCAVEGLVAGKIKLGKLNTIQ